MAISIKRKENKVNVRVKDTIVKTFANPDDYVLKTDIVDSLDSSATDKPLSANQGAELKKLINISEKYLTAVEVNESGNRLIFTLSDDTTIEADTSA